ncbi:MAG: hypothetical protein WBR18_13025 [Anaerolineales bacterium]
MMRWLLYGLIALAMAGCGSQPVATGILRGTVTVGPLTPVQRDVDPTPTIAAQVYTSRGLVISSEDGNQEISRVQFEADGTYQVTLPVGRYRIDLQPSGIDRADGLPTVVVIEAGATTRMDLDIDTGIR